ELSQAQAVEILKSRASTYRFLSRVYHQEVTAPFLSALVEQMACEAEEDTESEGYRTLREYVAALDAANIDKEQTELAAQYAALFLNVGPRPVSPYESVYTSPERLVMQKARDEVLAEYRKEGLNRISEYNEPEDHVAFELEFMAYLSEQAAEAVAAGDRPAAIESLQKQAGFLTKHIMVWVPQFCTDVQQAARSDSDFYRGIAQITDEHLANEGETIAELVEILSDGEEG
ncbi:MAG: molecular chaperone, partial [Anaerolineae bacterium]